MEDMRRLGLGDAPGYREGMTKYQPIGDHLRTLNVNSWRASFVEVERLLGFALPKSARLYPAWWANEGNGQHSHAKSWVKAGWITSDVDLSGNKVTFRRLG